MGYPEQRGRGVKKAAIGDTVIFKGPNARRHYEHVGTIISANTTLRPSGTSYVQYRIECDIDKVILRGPAAMFSVLLRSAKSTAAPPSA